MIISLPEAGQAKASFLQTSSTPGWSERTNPVDPNIRYDAPMSYDSARQAVVVFGGGICCGAPSLGDTWERIGTLWIQRYPSNSPSGRSGHSMAFDSARG